MTRTITTFLMLALALVAFGRQPERGYRGFIDWSNSYRTTANFTGFPRISSYYTGISTSHGYQFNPVLFVGAGLDFEHCSKIDSNILALYAHGRTDFKFGKFTPFADLRLGYNFVSGGGVYFSPSIGYRFNWGRKMGVNVAVGYTLQGYRSDVYEVINYDQAQNQTGWGIANKIGTNHGTASFFSFRLGIDF